MNVKLPGSGGNVIDIDVVRKDRIARRMMDQCAHQRVTIDPALRDIECRDCKKSLSPVEWLAQMVEHWTYIRRITDDYNLAKAEYEEAERVSRCKCMHCGKMTRVPERRSRAESAADSPERS